MLACAVAEMDSDGNGEVDFEEFAAWWRGTRAGQPGHSTHDDSSLRARLMSGSLGEASKSLLGLAGITVDEEVAQEAAETASTSLGRMVKEVTGLNGLEPSVFATRLAALQMAGSPSSERTGQDAATKRLEAGIGALHGAGDAIAFPTLAAAVAAIVATGGHGTTVICAASEIELLAQVGSGAGSTAGTRFLDCATIARLEVRSVLAAVGNTSVATVDVMNPTSAEATITHLHAAGKVVSALVLPAVVQPTQRVPDIDQLCHLIRRFFPACIIVVDNSGIGPYLSRPLLRNSDQSSDSSSSPSLVDVVVDGFRTDDGVGSFGCVVLRNQDEGRRSPAPGDGAAEQQQAGALAGCPIDTAALGSKLRRWRECVGAAMSSHTIALADASLAGHQLRLHHAATASLELAEFLSLLPCVSRVLCTGMRSDQFHERALQMLEAPYCTGNNSVTWVLAQSHYRLRYQ